MYHETNPCQIFINKTQDDATQPPTEATTVHYFFTSDLHGNINRYKTLFQTIETEQPDAVLIGGDLLPTHEHAIPIQDFLHNYLFPTIQTHNKKTRFLIILGNDDPRIHETAFQQADHDGILSYIHERTTQISDYTVAGYAYVPPTPFLLKDWERYDVSRHDDVGTIPPSEGTHTIEFSQEQICSTYISDDLEQLAQNLPMNRTIFLFHSPPYQTPLDRADLNGKMVDHAPLDVHVGSIAIRRFIEHHQPLLTLHGHVHEAARLTNQWKIKINKTYCFNGSTDSPKLSLISFDPAHLSLASRKLLG
jgi:uncharacterized protein